MNRKLLKYYALGFITVSSLGAFMHFVYGLSGENKIVALFSSVNESPWEHLKLLFFPFCLFQILILIKFRNSYSNLPFSAYIGVLSGMITITCYYYTLTGATGKPGEAINISSFFVGVFIAFLVSYLTTVNKKGSAFNKASIALIFITIGIFWLFTFYPPYLPLFQDPQTLGYSYNI